MASFSSSTVVSTLTRPRVAIVVVSTITAASLGYYYYFHARHGYSGSDLSSTGPGLHRRNAVRRSRRASHRRDDSSDTDSHGDENAETPDTIPTIEALPHIDDRNPEEWYNDNNQAPRQRTGENIVSLLFRVSEDNARRNAYVHRGCQCNSCAMVPIRGIRYRCANCADFDLCEVCESQGLHNKTHVFYKVRVPAPPFGTRNVQPVWYPGDPDSSPRNLPRPLLLKWSQETGFERVELDAFWEQWTFMANTEWRDDPNNLGLAMDRKTFERCLVPSGGYRHAAPNLIHDRMFAFYDTNHDDLIGFEEFLHGVTYRKRRDKLRRTFEGYDIDGDGYVSRRDFLRMFRAYYVLYKQMHKDILDGLDDHMMTTTEAQQLINGRQPLSSLFGREGRVPPADHLRPMEGKIFRSNGDVEVNDNKGVVNEDKPDTSDREGILRNLFSSSRSQSAFTESFGSGSRRNRSPNDGETRYWSGIINPPHNTVDLASLLQGHYPPIDDIIEALHDHHSRPATDVSGGSSDEDGQSEPEAADEGAEASEDDEQPEQNGTSETTESALTRAIPDASRFTSTLPTESQLRVQHQAIVANGRRLGVNRQKKVNARRLLLDRWKRRHFYLDEEEGAQPPQGWNEDQDVLLNLNGIADSSKSAPHFLSPRSRSSSKVRFAEDDDLETRSNVSTSSRSVPERWGGMEIPDAERDAGKEILYQVTQQAFNELLDEIFQKKEDLAIEAAETKELREKYRALVDTIDLEEEEERKQEAEESRDQSRERRSHHHHTHHHTHTLDDNRSARDRSLDELLTIAGYTTDDLPDLEPLESSSPEVQDFIPKTQVNGDETAPEEESEYRDPTLPQNRPNSTNEIPRNNSSVKAKNGQPKETISRAGPSNEQRTKAKVPQPDSPPEIPHSTLVEWKRINLAEQEARERGGWGRLSYREFENIYRDHEFQDSGRNRLDYLGSWIDFCIP
ncbi:EF-hand [Hypoxylon trugodes]|uniref:EF-hand n=1 Tax=Hypoxylon trugodes TaxID=326681 RepID=UPI0021966CCA|nr:EF-hand [Hypoxylon trugodes]KAI1383950.1 EF-hand [Hypoxylon trugodes]